MALDSNQPYNRVHNGGDGIWDGAAWGLGASAVSMSLLYGATVPGAKYLEDINQKSLVRGNERIASIGARRGVDVNQRIAKRVADSEMFTYRMNQMQGVGGSLFGGKRALLTGTLGALGGAAIGAGIDHLRD